MSSRTKIIINIILIFYSQSPLHAMETIITQRTMVTSAFVALELLVLGLYTKYSFNQHPTLPSYLHFFNYRLLTTSVDIIQAIKSRILFTQLHYSKMTKEQQITLLQNRLKTIKKEVFNKEKALTIDIIEMLDCTIDFYQEKCLNPLLAFSKKVTTEKQIDTIHDETLDELTLTTTKTMLASYGLNPDCFTIQYADNISFTAQTIIPEYENFTSLYESAPSSHIFITKPSHIEYNKNTFPTLSLRDKYAFIAHETSHAYYNHAEKIISLNQFIKIMSLTRKLDMQKEKQIKQKKSQILTIQEEQAEIFPSINSYSISSCMRFLRNHGYYPGHLYIEHYNTLSTINELHKIIQWVHTTPAPKLESYTLPNNKNEYRRMMPRYVKS